MRSWRWWLPRILIAAGLVLAVAAIDHYVFHRSFAQRLVLNAVLVVLLFGPMMPSLYREHAGRQRRATAQQQPSTVPGDAPEAARPRLPGQNGAP